MTTSDWPASLFDTLRESGVPIDASAPPALAPMQLLCVPAEDWGRVAAAAKAIGCRWVAGFGDDIGDDIVVNACFERAGVYVLARTRVPRTAAVVYSHTPHFAGANRLERHMQDLYGVTFIDHPDRRRWTRHQAWGEDEYPLRRDFPAAGRRNTATPADRLYPFLSAHGAGAYEIPVGPVHAGVIEPGHFRFLAVGETVLNLEERLAYVHKGIEKIAEGRDAAGLTRLAARVSGDTTVGHAYAACVAMERAAAIEIPARAIALRAVMAERERIANHLGDIGAVLNDVSFTFGFYQFGRLREQWCRTSREAFGHRFMMDRIIPGGVVVDIGPEQLQRLRAEIETLRAEVTSLAAIYTDLPTVEDRLVTTGYLNPVHARALGTLGYVGRASGVDFDVRRDAPYPPYDRLQLKVPVYQYGDVAARVRVRAEEILASCDLLEQLLGGLPAGPIAVPWRAPADGTESAAAIEGWRGEIFAYVRFGADGRVARYFPRDPSVFNWPALELLIHDNIVPDFPVCNKSVNGSYSGNDL